MPDQRLICHIHTKLTQRRTLNINRHRGKHARSTGTAVHGNTRE